MFSHSHATPLRNPDATASAPIMIDSGGSRRSAPSQLIVGAVVLALSAGALMGMRAYGSRSGINFEKVSAESTYKEDADRTLAYDRIMADLARVNRPLDVPLEDFGHSPFLARVTEADVGGTAVSVGASHTPLTPETAEEKNDRVAAARKAQLMAEVAKLELHTVMGGRVPLARINDETVGLNGTIGPFTVVAIEGRGVTLEAEGYRFNLTMQAFGDQQPRKGTKR
ncbi:MAG TPA: hypothetical protein VHN77_15820 [Phycisphaerales bacterium]|nr:hypothetical protein [Phycisphaerales bacterium]